MSVHTPGPWFRIPAHSTVWSGESKSEAVCVMTSGDYEANANLIAAAPDLLEALENCEKRLTNMVGMSDLCANELQASIDVARKAIARAKGEA